MGKRKVKHARKAIKKPIATRKPSLEEMYRQYLVPMAAGEWSNVHDLSQPSILKQIPTKTAYSSVE